MTALRDDDPDDGRVAGAGACSGCSRCRRWRRCRAAEDAPGEGERSVDKKATGS